MKCLVVISICLSLCAVACSSRQNEHVANSDTVYIKNEQLQPAISDNNTTVPDKEEATAQQQNLIIPGQKIGSTALGITADSLARLLGQPDKSDAAMGKAWLTWLGKSDEHNNATRLDIYITYPDSTMRYKTVQQIHATSSWFHTAGGLHVYSAMADIRKSYPGLKKAARYKSDGRTITLYDDKEQGIAFEAVPANNEDICTGIIIHKPGIAVTNTYIFLYPDAKLIQ